jgi:glycosyltransferase involved in cell wall biosynthesis
LEALRSRVAREGLAGHVEFVGFVKDRAQLPAFYQQADVFASPADHEVGVANVYVEAMACGCPVVASTTGGAPEAVLNGETGLLVPPRDVGAMMVAIDRILGNAELRRRLGKGGRRRAEAYFAADKYIGRVLAAYEKTIARSRDKLVR